MRGITTAFRTLSTLPVPGKDADDFSAALSWFPLVGLVLGGIIYGVAALLNAIPGVVWPEGIGITCVSLGVFLTRGLHLDGLADWADGFWGGYTKEKILAIMKDTYLGTFGVISLILILSAKWIAIAKLVELNRLQWIVAAAVIARTLQVEQIVTLPYARKEGTAGPFVKNAGQHHRAAAHFMALVVLGVLFNIGGIVCFVICFLVIKIFGRWCMKKVGGITGDLLGTGSELIELFVLFFLAFLPPRWNFPWFYFEGLLQ
jgi:adenosylcobinamide-GDP ribazoletransferase